MFSAGRCGRRDTGYMRGAIALKNTAQEICQFLHRACHERFPFPTASAFQPLDPFHVASLTISRLFVYRWIARRACFPSAMHPEPLVWMPPYVIFKHARKSLRVFANVHGVVTRADEVNLRLKTEPVFPSQVVPVNEHRDDCGTCVQRETRKASRRTGRDPEKIDKHALGRLRVLIG